ncbi:MAG TPA: hypothetical protein VFK76_12895 [Gaiellaceae bacterium]|nr:hypothetical protein [Gaiellaceae bacterium]
MTTLASTTDFTTGAVLSWALPIGIVLVVLFWWAAVLTVRAFKLGSGGNGPGSRT